MKYRGSILICDGTVDAQGDVIDIAGVSVKGRSIPVFDYAEGNFPIGTCEVHKGVDRLVGVFEFSRLKPEQATLFPAVCGGVLKRNGHVVEECIITSVELTPRNADSRIQRFADMMYQVPNRHQATEECQHEPVQMIFSSFCKKCNKTL